MRAALEAIAYQTRDVVECIGQDSGIALETLRVDGGACENDFLMQFQADVLGVPVQRPAAARSDGEGRGAAGRPGRRLLDGSRASSRLSRAAAAASSRACRAQRREELYAGWKRAVERARDWVPA